MDSLNKKKDTMEMAYSACASLIANCRSLIITAGAGMGVDSGMPDFRGSQGWWQKHNKEGLGFISLASPENFRERPELVWGFYGYRINMYKNTSPHKGFQIILDWIERYRLEYFVVTSNVDGHFQKAGFSPQRIYECHGSLSFLQCTDRYCMDAVWVNTENIEVTEDMKALHIPKCPYCGKVARPNVLLFADSNWIPHRYNLQKNILDKFWASLEAKKDPVVIIEIGAGMAIPRIRHTTMEFAKKGSYVTAIRINPAEPKIDFPHISLATSGLEALEHIEQRLAHGNLAESALDSGHES